MSRPNFLCCFATQSLIILFPSVPDILVQAIQCLVSTRRIQKYLDSPEIADLAEGEVAVRQGTAISNGIEIACEAATVTWPTGSDKKAEFSATTNTFELQNLSLKFPARALSLVCGSLGSGKTLLLLGSYLSLVV